MSVFKSTEDFKKVVPAIHLQYNWEKELKRMTQQAAELYVTDYMSQAEYDLLVTNYTANTLTTEQDALLPYVRKAVGYYTYMRMHDTLSVHMSAQGLQESHSDYTQPASNYAKNDSKLDASKVADRYLGDLLAFMEKEVIATNTKYALWQASDAYNDIFELFVWDTATLAKHTGLNSRRVLQMLRHSIRWVQERDICGIVGETLYLDLVAKVKARPTTALTTAFNSLLQKIQPFLAVQALLEAIPSFRVEMADGLLHFRSYDGPRTRAFTEMNEGTIRQYMGQLEAKAAGARTSLEKFLELNADDYTDYTSKKLLDTNDKNRLKPGIWNGNASVAL